VSWGIEVTHLPCRMNIIVNIYSLSNMTTKAELCINKQQVVL
jgi:hypothetical protein